MFCGFKKTLVLSLLALSLIGCQQNPSEPSSEQTAKQAQVPLMTVQAEHLSSHNPNQENTPSQSLLGVLQPSQSSSMSFTSGGELVDIAVKEGHSVPQGALLATLDSRALLAQDQQLQAQIQAQQALLREAKRGARKEQVHTSQLRVNQLQQELSLLEIQLQRRQKLYQEGAIPKEQLDQFQNQKKTLQLSIQQAQSQVRDLKLGPRPDELQAQAHQIQSLQAQRQQIAVALSQSQLYAPYPCVVIKKHFDVGSIVAPGQPVLTLVAQKPIEIHLFVPQHDNRKWNEGEFYNFSIGDEKIRARFGRRELTLSPATQTQTLIFFYDQSWSSEYTIGQTVTFREPAPSSFADNQQERLLAPSSALEQDSGGRWHLYLLEKTSTEKEYKLVRTSTEITGYQGDLAVLKGDFKKGDLLLTQGLHKVVDGQLVRWP